MSRRRMKRITYRVDRTKPRCQSVNVISYSRDCSLTLPVSVGRCACSVYALHSPDGSTATSIHPAATGKSAGRSLAGHLGGQNVALCSEILLIISAESSSVEFTAAEPGVASSDARSRCYDDQVLVLWQTLPCKLYSGHAEKYWTNCHNKHA